MYNVRHTISLLDSRLTVLPPYCFSSSMQKTKAWKRKKMIMGKVMRWMTTQTTVPTTSDSTVTK